MRHRVCFAVPIIEEVDTFLVGHISAMTAVYDVCVVAPCRDKHYLKRHGLDVDVHYAPILRNPAPLRDAICLVALFALFRRLKPDVVHSLSPKTGLLAMLAATAARIPVRLHTFTGQVWATRKGLARAILRRLDRVLGACATHLFVDSHSQMEFLVRQKVVSAGKASVLANGSICGVDTARFRPQPLVHDEVRRDLGIPGNATVFAYMGRLKRDKGLLDLAEAFSSLCERTASAYLIVVGRDEERIKPQMERLCTSCAAKVRFIDWTPAPERYVMAADVLCLPSYREGFGSVIIEAAACGIPSLASRIYGVTDAVADGITGILHEPGNVRDLASAMERFVQNPSCREAMGKRARERAETLFAADIVTAALLKYYAAALAELRQDDYTSLAATG